MDKKPNYFKITSDKFFNFGTETPIAENAPERYCKRHPSGRKGMENLGAIDGNGKYFDYLSSDGKCIEITKEEYEKHCKVAEH
jgi:hypothetical protein